MSQVTSTQKMLVLAVAVAAMFAAVLGSRSPHSSSNPTLPLGQDPAQVVTNSGAILEDEFGETLRSFDPITRFELIEHMQVLSTGVRIGRGAAPPTARADTTAGDEEASPAAHVETAHGGAHGGARGDGFRTTGEYVTAAFAGIGLQPGAGLDHVDPFDVRVGAIAGPGAFLDFRLRQSTFSLERGVDWSVLPISGDGAAAGSLVFCGYGRHDASPLRNDFRGVDVAGKVVLILASPDAQALREAAGSAERRGAAAVLVTSVGEDAIPAIPPIASDLSIPVIGIRYGALAPLLGAMRVDLADLADVIDATRQARSFAFDAMRCDLDPDVEPALVSTRNVVGILRGSGDRSRAGERGILIVGTFQERELDSHPEATLAAAADGSAVAALIEIAEAVRSRGAALQRTIVFAALPAVGSREVGLDRFLDKPPYPLSKIGVVIHIGSLGTTHSMFAAGGALRRLRGLVEGAADDFGIELRPGPGVSRVVAGCGQRGLEGLVLGDAVPGSGGDEASPYIDLNGVERQSRMICDLIVDLAGGHGVPDRVGDAPNRGDRLFSGTP